MNLNKTNKQKRESESSRLTVLRLKKANSKDFIFMALLLFFGVLAVWTGQMNGLNMTPYGAAKTAETLDELELPRQLPNQMVVREDGASFLLWDLVSTKRNILNIYAPWCSACQKELPILVESLSVDGNLIVLISKKEKISEVDEQLKNLGLQNIHYYRDVTGEILRTGKVSKLPTTFLLRDFGKVLERVVGYSEYELNRIVKRAKEVSAKYGE